MAAAQAAPAAPAAQAAPAGPARPAGPAPAGPARPAGPAPAGSPAGRKVNRITWLPGTDRLAGTCHCGASAEADDPAAMWNWLLAHPAHPARP
jgi:hypothetical protein